MQFPGNPGKKVQLRAAASPEFSVHPKIIFGNCKKLPGLLLVFGVVLTLAGRAETLGYTGTLAGFATAVLGLIVVVAGFTGLTTPRLVFLNGFTTPLAGLTGVAEGRVLPAMEQFFDTG